MNGTERRIRIAAILDPYLITEKQNKTIGVLSRYSADKARNLLARRSRLDCCHCPSASQIYPFLEAFVDLNFASPVPCPITWNAALSGRPGPSRELESQDWRRVRTGETLLDELVFREHGDMLRGANDA
ncbi:hypothetical protein PHLCEN_2v4858 [Hermanssonia centrifuga]|uniref:Uncharacterized protein n=1 Tax=Hermanssonia centrifuga TaxID=98765 RepID=A0A2R6PGN1_9APHY|nr:hypothetical protein PHLCEN_2v4858 [Hermanssonia centrifuga]